MPFFNIRFGAKFCHDFWSIPTQGRLEVGPAHSRGFRSFRDAERRKDRGGIKTRSYLWKVGGCTRGEGTAWLCGKEMGNDTGTLRWELAANGNAGRTTITMKGRRDGDVIIALHFLLRRRARRCNVRALHLSLSLDSARLIVSDASVSHCWQRSR